MRISGSYRSTYILTGEFISPIGTSLVTQSKFLRIKLRFSLKNDFSSCRIREIRLIIGGQSTPSKKEIEMKLSWDSNRDPTQEVNNQNKPKLFSTKSLSIKPIKNFHSLEIPRISHSPSYS